MIQNVVNFEEKFSLFRDLWSPKVIAQMNDYQMKLVRIKGDFIWHSHKETDEVFIVLEGSMRIDFRDRQILLKEGEMFVVPRGEEHKPFSEEECRIMIIEPEKTVNTGEAGGSQTAENDVWI